MKFARIAYPTDLTDAQWDYIAPLLGGLRTYKWQKRELVDATLYVVKNGVTWRNLPHDFPPWKTVYSFYMRASKSGLWDRILMHLVELTRQNAGRAPSPSYAIVDSQSVKTVYASEERGMDGGKKNQRPKTTHRG